MSQRLVILHERECGERIILRPADTYHTVSHSAVRAGVAKQGRALLLHKPGPGILTPGSRKRGDEAPRLVHEKKKTYGHLKYRSHLTMKAGGDAIDILVAFSASITLSPTVDPVLHY